MKTYIVNYVVKCLECQQVKDKHRYLVGLLQPHVIPKSKWEVISMGFIVGFPLIARRHDSIFVVINTLMKSAHFIPVCMTYITPDIARMFVSEIVRLNGVPRKIISDQESILTGRFWISFQETLGGQLNFSTSSHLEIDGKTERMNQILEDMI
jgi:hypothetical protein